MKTSILLFFFILLFVFSCKNDKTRPNLSLIQDLDILDTSKFQTGTSNLQLSAIDTFKYSNLPFWDTTMNRFYSAYIDTFSVDGNLFRFINPYANKRQLDIVIYLEKLSQSKWIYFGFTLRTMNYVGDYDHSRDVNGDGFIDITQDLRFNKAVYFYDTVLKSYHRNLFNAGEAEGYVSYDFVLLDTTRKIFCDFAEGKQMCGHIHSSLYTYDSVVRRQLYDLGLYNCTDNDTHLITRLILSKCLVGDSLVLIREIPLPEPIDIYKIDSEGKYFDYVKFWKQRYKQLLGYR